MNKRISWILALALLLVGVATVLADSPVDISADVTTVPENSTVLDWGMVPLAANTTAIDGCEYVYKLDAPVPPDAEATIDAPDPYEGQITFTVTGNKDDGYTIQVTDTVDGYTVVIEQVYFGIGNDARKFTFDPGITYASPLPAPLNPSGELGDISHTFFCYNFVEEEEEEECEWIGETAWAYGPRYVETGNWATYTPYPGDGGSVEIFAGQTMLAGTATFADNGDGTVTISIVLDAGWRFEENEDSDDNVMVQDYDEAPSGNPAPGLFDHKGYATGSTFDITVPLNNFYGIHLVVEWEFCE
jgi:hypothetical protein